MGIADPIGWKGDKVRLVPPDRRLHLENALRWMNDPEVCETLKVHLGVTRAQEAAFFDQIERRDGSDWNWAIVRADGRHIGFIGLKVNWQRRTGVGGIVLGDKGSWGLGFATDAVRVRTRLAFEEMGLHRIEGHTQNPAMRRVYEKAGYLQEGVARKVFWRGGAWHDATLHAILEEDYFRRREPAD